MRSLLLLPFLLFSLKASEINIAVAANVSYAMNALKSAFMEDHPEVDVRVTLGSSGKLTAQIKNGAPYGLFMSANMRYPQALYDENLTLTVPKVYAEGTLALFSVHEQNLSKGLSLLSDAKIRRIAIANPKTAPYGIAAEEALRQVGLYTTLQKKFVFGESVAQTLSYAVTAADIGIVATSSLYSDKMQMYHEGKHWSRVDRGLYRPIKQGMVLLRYADDIPEYGLFYHFMFSKKAQEILKTYGYIVHE